MKTISCFLAFLIEYIFSRITQIYIIIFIVSRLSGVSAPPHSFEIEQVNGQKISVRMYGHEYYNWLETDDGYVVDWVDNEYKKLN